MITISRLTKRFGRVDSSCRASTSESVTSSAWSASERCRQIDADQDGARSTHADAGEIRVDGVPITATTYRIVQTGYMQIARFPENLCARELFAMLQELQNVDEDDEPAMKVSVFSSSTSRCVCFPAARGKR